jgi:hypothetical protein
MISSALIFNSEIFTDYLVYNDERHTEYLVTVDHEEGTVKCDCPDFKFRRQNQKYGCVKIGDVNNYCKHIRNALGGNNEI